MAFGVIQYGLEGTATPGTPVAPTDVLSGFEAAEWGTDYNIEQPELLTQSYALHQSGVILGRTGRLTLRNGICDYEQLPVWLALSLKAPGTAAAGSAYDYSYTPSMTADEAFNTATFRADFDGYESSLAYGFVDSFELACAGPRARTNLTVNITGWAWDAAGTIYAGITSPDPETVSGGAWNIWLDDDGGTVGQTAYPGCLKSFTFRSGPLRAVQECMDGTDQFSGVVKPRYNPQLQARMVLDDSLADLLDDYAAGQRKLIQLQAEGTDTGGGTAKAITIQMAGRITECSRIGAAIDQEQWVVDITFGGEYSATLSNVFNFTVRNAESTLRGS